MFKEEKYSRINFENLRPKKNKNKKTVSVLRTAIACSLAKIKLTTMRRDTVSRSGPGRLSERTSEPASLQSMASPGVCSGGVPLQGGAAAAAAAASIGAITILDGVHDTVGENGHLAGDCLHSLLELSDVRTRGEDTVKA